MFDSLRDRLGNFREDVEERAEVEEAEEPADQNVDPGEDGQDAETDTHATDGPDETEPASAEEEPGLTARAGAALTGKTFIEEEDLEKPLEELELALLASDVEMTVAERILERVREELVGTTRAQVTATELVVEDALREALLEVIAVGQFDFEDRLAETDPPVTIVFTGPNGVGKTTTIAKLASYLEDRGYETVLANGDTYRAGANEQLQEHAEALGRPAIAHEQGADPAAVVYDAVEYAQANDMDVVLGDTAGRLHTSSDLMAQLEKIDRVVEPDLTIFVDEAVAGQDAVQRAREFDEASPIDGTILTKADADANGGAAISIAFVTGKPILFLGTGQAYDDLVRFDPAAIVDRLLGED